MSERDEVIKKDVVDELFWDNRIDASQINVSVENGVVTLTGEVPAYSVLSIAKSAVFNIEGVSDVIDNLVVRYAAPPGIPTDSEIKTRAENILNWDPTIDEDSLDVSVHDGVVTLEGTVEGYWKKWQVKDRVSGIRGILGIEEKLAVVPSRRITDEIIARDIIKSMDRDLLVETENVTVEVENGVAKLFGEVPGWLSRRAAETDASYTSGVIDVRNELRVST